MHYCNIQLNFKNQKCKAANERSSMSTALIIVDVQNDFCPCGSLEVKGGDEIVPLINRMMAGYENIILTQDWHPKEHSSFASAQHGKLPYDVIDMDYGPQILWPDHCIQGTKGAEFHGDLRTSQAGLIIRKGFNPKIDSYSAFFENDLKTPTGLHGYLQNRGITDLDIVGLATDFCVKYSALDAVKLGYQARVLESACRAIDMQGSLAAARHEMHKAGVILGA